MLYWAVFKANYQVNLSYRAALIIQTLRDIIIVFLFIFLWHALFQTQDQIGGYTFKSIVVYYILVRLFDRFYTFHPSRVLNRYIRTGDLSNYLTKPIKMPLYLAAYGIGQRFAAITLTVMVVVGLFIFVPQIMSYPATMIHGLYFFVFSLLSWVMFYELVLCFGVISFWTTEIGNIRVAFDQLILLLGGLLVPLDLFPTWFGTITNYLPFKYLFFFLVQVYQGKIHPDSFGQHIAIEVVWIVALGGLFYFLWKHGVKRYESYGK